MAATVTVAAIVIAAAVAAANVTVTLAIAAVEMAGSFDVSFPKKRNWNIWKSIERN